MNTQNGTADASSERVALASELLAACLEVMCEY